MSQAFRPLILLAIAAIFLVAGCSTAGTSDAKVAVREVSSAEAVQMLDSYTVIDVRTPAGFATGHVAGALDIPVEASDFGDRIAQPIE